MNQIQTKNHRAPESHIHIRCTLSTRNVSSSGIGIGPSAQLILLFSSILCQQTQIHQYIAHAAHQNNKITKSRREKQTQSAASTMQQTQKSYSRYLDFTSPQPHEHPQPVLCQMVLVKPQLRKQYRIKLHEIQHHTRTQEEIKLPSTESGLQLFKQVKKFDISGTHIHASRRLPETSTFSSLINGGGGGGGEDAAAGGSKMGASCSGTLHLHSVQLFMEISIGALISAADIIKIDRRKIDRSNPRLIGGFQFETERGKK